MTAHANAFSASRRRALLGIGAVGAALTVPADALATISQKPRHLHLYNLHTDEALKLDYWADGDYIEDALDELNVLLRDFRTGDVYPIDRRVLDFLCIVQQTMNSRGVFEVISGYRSPKTNAKLRAQSKGVAKRSYHMRGMAIDVRLRDRELSQLRRTAMGLKLGGVGYYRKSNFVHLDIGRVRTW
ncbi:MAG: DUF882 domain-containing protein [Pseudomonadota bacterium]